MTLSSRPALYLKAHQQCVGFMNRLRFLEMPGSTNVFVPRSHNYHGLTSERALHCVHISSTPAPDGFVWATDFVWATGDFWWATTFVWATIFGGRRTTLYGRRFLVGEGFYVGDRQFGGRGILYVLQTLTNHNTDTSDSERVSVTNFLPPALIVGKRPYPSPSKTPTCISNRRRL